jgi:KaiC/GvpD/RAD55 family RecA-like ATPase
MAIRNSNVTDLSEHKKKQLNERQLAFIEIARRILASNPMPSQEDINALSGSYPLIAKTLREARRDGSEEDFTTAYDAMSNEYTQLKDWRSLIGVPGSEEEEDKRFRIGKTGKKVIIRCSEDDIDALPDKEDLIKDILEKGTVSMIYGPAGTGKTFNALHIAYCIAHGVDWFGHEVEQGKVWYINTEGGRGLKPRIRAWRKEYKRDKTSNIEFITWPVHLKEHSQELLDTVDEADEKPDLLVVDNYSMCATGTNQNDQMEVTRTLMVLHEIAQRYGCHCLLVHHSNWTGKVNGSAAFRNHVDTMLDLSKPSKEGPIFLRCEKQRDGEQFADIHLELKIVSPYAHPVTGEFITSCVVALSDAPVMDELNPKQRQCLDLLVDGLTLGEWQRFVEDANVGVSRRTLERFRDLFEEKGIIERQEHKGKHDTYHKKSNSNPFEVNGDE